MLLIEGLLPENDCELGTQGKGMAKLCSTSFNLARPSCAYIWNDLNAQHRSVASKVAPPHEW